MFSLRLVAVLTFLAGTNALLDTTIEEFTDVIGLCLLDNAPVTCSETIDYLKNDDHFQDFCTVRRATQLDQKCIVACDLVPDQAWCNQLCSRARSVFANAATCARACNVRAGPTDGSTPVYCATLVDAFVSGCSDPTADPELREACDVTEKDFLPLCESSVSTAGDQLFESCSKACAAFPTSSCADAYCSGALSRGLLTADSPLIVACAQQCAIQAGVDTPAYCLPLLEIFVEEDCNQFYTRRGNLRNGGDGLLKDACVLTRNTLGVICENDDLFSAIERTDPPCDFSGINPANPDLCDAFPLDYC